MNKPTNHYNRNIAASTQSMTVSELNRQTKSLLENSFINLRVQGEISNFAKPSSGHWYFTLKDARAQVRCAMFRGNNRAVRFTPKEGDEIIVQAKVSLYEGRGDYQLICDSMEQAGSGRLQIAFEQLKAKLHKEGLFDSSYKKSLPRMVTKLGVITSPSGAAIHDITSVLKRRFPGLEVSLYPSAVQGAQASTELVNALALAQQHNHCDVIIIGRGGGSLEDLWPFNEERVARAIFKCKIPVISAVGHEVDFSIADLVADYRAATPSAAAELISPDQDSVRLQIDRQLQRLQSAQHQAIILLRKKIELLSSRLQSPQQQLNIQQLKLNSLKKRLLQPLENKLASLEYRSALVQQKLNTLTPQHALAAKQLQLDHIKSRLNASAVQAKQTKQLALHTLMTTLDSISPLATLQRGYSITRNQHKEIIISSQQLASGDLITTKLNSGYVASKVISVEPETS